MSVKIIQISDGGAEEYDSVKQWADINRRYCSAKYEKEMIDKIERMPSGSVASFGGGWVLKDVPEVDIKC